MLTPAVNPDLCVGCGICADVCPLGNIALTDGKARCGDNCTQCLACVHFCPQQAVELNRKPTPKAHQYHHPNVTVGDMKR
jgi:ferredoxin